MHALKHIVVEASIATRCASLLVRRIEVGRRKELSADWSAVNDRPVLIFNDFDIVASANNLPSVLKISLCS
jgi:hypothetical protein